MFFGNVFARIVFFLQSGRLFSEKQNRSDVQRNRLIPRSWVQVFNSFAGTASFVPQQTDPVVPERKFGVWSAKKMASSSRPFVASSLAAGTDQWKRCEVLLNSYHIEIFQQSVANDLVELQQCTDLLPEATWMGSRGPEASIENLVCDVPELQQQNRSVENAVTCPEEMTKSAKCPPESATVRGSWGGMGCPRVRAIESNLAEGKRIWEFLAFEACPRPETHWNLSAESGDEILFL